MTKEYLETILTEYGVAFTDSLADRLLKEFEPSNDMVSRGVFEQVMWERDVAIEQLKELGYELGQKVEPCDDAVSRQAAIEAFQMFREYESNRSNKEWVDRIETVLNQLPPVNPQPKTGHWITQWNLAHQKEYYYCSECREEYSYDGETGIKMNDYNYCSNCGAKMQESEGV